MTSEERRDGPVGRVGRDDRAGEQARVRVRVASGDGVFVISVAAELAGVHPQTLRTWERQGLLTPSRTTAGGRRYSQDDVELVARISELTGQGIALAGVRRILALEAEVSRLRALLAGTDDDGQGGP